MPYFSKTEYTQGTLLEDRIKCKATKPDGKTLPRRLGGSITRPDRLYFLTMSLPNHLVEMVAALPSAFMSSIAFSIFAINSASSLRVPIP